MSIMYCERHDLRWDSDFKEACPRCEDEPEPRAPSGATIYDDAVELLKGGCDVAALPRRLGIGQIVADDVLARLEREGIIGKPGRNGKREVLT